MSSVELRESSIRVRFSPDGSNKHADFHPRWLRHHGGPEHHPKTGERTLCSADLPDDLCATAGRIEGEVLHLEFSDGVAATYPLPWLAEEAYAEGRVDVPPPPSDLGPITIQMADTGDAHVAAAIAGVKRDGIAIVRANAAARADAAATTEPLVQLFEKRGLTIVPTHFGRIEDLRVDNTTNENTDQLGYTDASIQLHTDQPFIADPPRYQLLQSIRSADKGGGNFIVDGLAAARYLESLDEADVELLRTVPVRFHRKQKAFTSLQTRPILEVDGPLSAPRAFQIRLSYFTVAPYRVSFAKMNAWYRAHDRFVRLCRDEKNQYRFALEPGDFVLYDNHRMLHARTGFSGPRWVRGIYFNP